ncbi:acyltransferase [Adonisia turfae]|uniref:Acyl transferase n=1 Tax=Adonisia turfae CCMR0081 TaxID=2292702 RepID=A0A6M0RHC0_9CYAN|nr:DapH/DapD/GlmU-related protein [Adonisia turfae]NEZ55310.1 acyl transferase [Adonisia turfae CCMR0081]
MTLLSKFLSFFPTLTLSLATVSLAYGIWEHSLWSVMLCLFFLYGFPILSYRIHHSVYPLENGISYLQGSDYSPWWGSHQFQLIYIAFPALETLLRLVPGVFSLWLRLWGAHIGKQVYWTPALEIADRGLLTIGDGVVFGHRVGMYSHIIKPRRDNLMLYLKPITIGDGSFIGAGSYIGPGAMITAGSYLEAGSEIYPNSTVNSAEEHSAEEKNHGLAD